MVILEEGHPGRPCFLSPSLLSLAFALGLDLNSISDASVRSLEDREPPLKSVLFVTNEP
jgi:hypothetical protein